MRLTDERLHRLWMLTVISFPDNEGKFSAERDLVLAAPALIAELRQLRELLATPTDPVGMEQPDVVALVDGTHAVAWGIDLEGYDMQPIEAIGYGATLIRAALEARALTAQSARGEK